MNIADNWRTSSMNLTILGDVSLAKNNSVFVLIRITILM